MNKTLLRYLILLTFIILFLKYQIKIQTNLINTSIYFFKIIFPTLFPILIITNYINRNIIPNTNNKLLYFLSNIFSFAPTNAILSTNPKILLYTTIMNPFYSFKVLSVITSKYKSILIIIINMIINYIFLIINIKKTKIENIKNNHNENEENIFCIIKNAFNSLINIFIVALFFSIIISLFPSNYLFKYITIFIDITNGFKILPSLRNKLFIAILLNNTCGLSIYMQQKLLNKKINGKFIFHKFTISLSISIITYLILLIIK